MAKLARQFFAGGNCVFTVKVPEAFASHHNTNLHYTYKIEQSEPSEKFPNPAWFIKLLIGPDNTSDYQYLGKFIPETGEVILTVRSCAGSASWAVRIVRRVLAQVFEGEGMDGITKHGWDVDHMNKCGRCGRPLTVPESVECGIGPECAAILGIPYPTRTKTPRKRKVKVVAEAVTAPERDPASDQEPPQIVGDLPGLPDVWF